MNNVGFNFNNSYASLPEAMHTRLNPAPVKNPELVIVNHALAGDLGLDLFDLDPKSLAALFAGNELPDGATPIAQAYAGHQFGHFTILGDGRAHLIGEHVTPAGKRVDIQFKGSGPTPYARRGDGRAALGPMLREYIISEAMYGLGVPTTRSLAVVTTGENVLRETRLPGAILTRIAASHLRVGTFEFAATHDNSALLKALLDYAVDRHYPEIKDSDNKAVDFLTAVSERQADLITHWMRIGFIHGVMNTDNMSISGETIDYGPCAFLDIYDPKTVFSSIDHGGRYAYGNQPVIAQWNLARLAEALLPLLDGDTDKAVRKAENIIGAFGTRYREKRLAMMRAKLGLFGAAEEDETLISDLLTWMTQNYADFTNSFRDLSRENKPDAKIYRNKTFDHWSERLEKRRSDNTEPREAALSLMQSVNPNVIPRNHKVEQALKAADAGDLQPLHDLLSVLQSPYADKENFTPYQTPPAPGERVYQTFCGT